jgi:hypothetical protein
MGRVLKFKWGVALPQWHRLFQTITTIIVCIGLVILKQLSSSWTPVELNTRTSFAQRWRWPHNSNPLCSCNVNENLAGALCSVSTSPPPSRECIWSVWQIHIFGRGTRRT